MLPSFVYRSEAFTEDLGDEAAAAGRPVRAAPMPQPAPVRGLPRWAPALLAAFALVSDVVLTAWLPAF
jgi:hypothetical protein